ncbi:hypothetical protein DFH09DRAFT_330667 [Mycena vulgaris]|nr:hypothetical protein DFH09DRAFT_330667 [Mycena vulgaris]
MALSLDTVRERLQLIGLDLYPIDLEKEVLDVTVRRDFIAEHYGGNVQITRPTIAEAFVEKTGKSKFLYPNLSYNPHCPEIPGAPGLLFNAYYPCAGEGPRVEQDPATYALIVRLDSSIWSYLGEYQKGPAPQLTVPEWKQQSPQVRKQWPKQIAEKGWGLPMRICVALRKQLGRQPTREEAETAEVAQKTAKKLAQKGVKTENGAKTVRGRIVKAKIVKGRTAKGKNVKYVPNVTAQEISDALDRGELILSVSTLKCVGYDINFQKDLVAKKPFFVPKPPKNQEPKDTASKSSKQKPGKVTPKPSTPTRKRKRGVSDDEDEEQHDEHNINYQHRGTASRPIRL